MKEPLDEIRTYYDDVYYRDISSGFSVSRHHRRLATMLGITSGTQVLDVGCGKGEWLMACKEMGGAPHGIDLSVKAIEVCKNSMPEGDFYCQAAEEFPFHDNQFSLISCLGSLEHFINPTASIKEMVRVAKQEAKILILVPNKEFLTRKLGFFSGTDQTNAKEDVRTIEEWENLFHNAGLEITSKWKDLHTFSWKWINRRGILHMPFRALQSILLTIWPLKWQYQVYFLCHIK